MIINIIDDRLAMDPFGAITEVTLLSRRWLWKGRDFDRALWDGGLSVRGSSAA